MKYIVVVPVTVKTPQGMISLPTGKVVMLSLSQAEQLGANVCQSNEQSIWKWFLFEADTIYRQASDSLSSWNYHKAHRRVAEAHCRRGNMPMAVIELRAALEALRDGTIDKDTSGRGDTTISRDMSSDASSGQCYCCKGTDFWQSAAQNVKPICRMCHPPAPGAEHIPQNA